MRVCAGCGFRALPDQLLRLYLDGEGRLQLDLKRRAEGRGLHVCARRRCFELIGRKRKIYKALRGGRFQFEPDVFIRRVQVLLDKRVQGDLLRASLSGRVIAGARRINGALQSGGPLGVVLATPELSSERHQAVIELARCCGVRVFLVSWSAKFMGQLIGTERGVLGGVRKGILANALMQNLEKLEALKK